MVTTKYQVFLKVAECENFTRAAEMLFLTQSGVSYTISSFEQELGVTLFNRNKGKVTLTSDGAKLLSHIKKIYDDELELENKAKSLQNLDFGTIRVATFTSVSTEWLPYIIKEFHNLYPNIEFELYPAEHNTIAFEKILKGEVDCGFICLPSKFDLETTELAMDKIKIIMSPLNPLCKKETLTIEDIKDEPFIGQNIKGEDYELATILDMFSLKPNIKYVVPADQTIFAMVSNNLGIGLMPELMLRNCKYELKTYDLPKPIYRHIGFCVKDKKNMSFATKKFLDFTIEWVKNNYKQEV